MPQSGTLIIRAALARGTYRDIEIEDSRSLYKLAEAIISSFGFDFDHAFGFYTGLTDATIMNKRPKYELFADMGEADSDALSVKKTKMVQAFPAVGHTMLFLFDYGDEWRFRVSLRGTAKKAAKVRYPRVVAAVGEPPEQYPEADEEDSPSYGINLLTGERTEFGRKKQT